MGLLLPTFRESTDYRVFGRIGPMCLQFTEAVYIMGINLWVQIHTFVGTLKLLWEIISWDISLTIGVELL